MLSQKSKYAIRAVLYLAANSQETEKLIGSKELASALKTPLAFTGKVLQELARKKIISSTKGPGGGFYLSEDNRSKRLMDILEAMDDLSYFTTCGLGLSACSDTQPCPIHETYKVSRDNLLELFNNTTIEELTKDIEKFQYYLVR